MMAKGKEIDLRVLKQRFKQTYMQHIQMFVAGLLATVILPAGANAAALASLKTVPVIEPPNLTVSFVRDKVAAIQLGKALFWDMQVGSDGVTACASCHFHAGADSRTRNQLNPGTRGGDDTFANNRINLPVNGAIHGGLGPNATVSRSNFPFHSLTDFDDIGEPLHNPDNVVSSVNDVMGSQGVPRRDFVDISIGNPVDQGTPVQDPIFANLRQVTGRNANSVINAAFNFTNFWDGRANNIFNGKTPFGPADSEGHVFVNSGTTLTKQALRIRQAALASQAVGPPLNDIEMSWRGRTWHKLGKKMLSLRPLNQQKVHSTDSVLGPIANANSGLNPSYTTLIQRAFYHRFWNNTTHHLELENPADPTSPLNPVPVLGPADPNNTSHFTQTEANFAFFFGMAIQLYESTLIADDSKLDRFLEGNGAFTPEEQRGMAIFNGAGSCVVCHTGPETTDAGIAGIQGANAITGIAQPLNQNPLNANELMPFATGTGFYDTPFHNLGVRPGGLPSVLNANEDIGRGGNSDFVATDPGNPSTTFPIPLSWGTLAVWKARPDLVGTTVPMPASLSPFVPSLPFGMKPTTTAPVDGQVSNFGAFKTPHLRNVELTGPYMHNGGFATLHQVVEFYTRGGDFPATNAANFDNTLIPLGIFLGSDIRKNELVAFLQTLTDQRVKNESAPFDHPELFIPVDGEAPVSPGTRAGFINANGVVATGFMRLPQVGSAGRTAQGLPQVGTFLNLQPTLP